MGLLRGWAAVPLAALVCGFPAYTAGRQVLNPLELHGEIKAAPGAEAAVVRNLLSFREYQDLIMFHPRFGYYASGRVSFDSDYQTYPIALAPYFGQMVAEQIFRMWQGMRKAGTLAPGERFTIAEFGAGNGVMASTILDYVEQRAKDAPQAGWREFAAQVLYICYDRSPALNKAQRERNARFGTRFEAREADATDLDASIKPASIKGVILSNELPDAFSVHKAILGPDGAAEAAFVAPSLVRKNWEKLRPNLPSAVVDRVSKGSVAVAEMLPSAKADHLYLTRQAFTALLEALASMQDYAAAVGSLEFEEVYLPAAVIPELDNHLRRYAALYAGEIAKNDRAVVTYINLGTEKFVQGAGRILKAGYVMTLDYGSTWEEIVSPQAHPHLRTYGPAHREENWDTDGANADDEKDTFDPYNGPTLNDLTTDVNFSMMEAAGRLAGLKMVYYGPQAALQAGTPIQFDLPPQSDGVEDAFFTWANDFQTDGVYKLFVQQKQGTDAAYAYPERKSERLVPDPAGLSELQRRRAVQIEKRLGPEQNPAIH